MEGNDRPCRLGSVQAELGKALGLVVRHGRTRLEDAVEPLALIPRRDVDKHLHWCPNALVQCKMKNEGCEWSGLRRLLQTHLEQDCGEIDDVCPSRECGKIMKRKDLLPHERICEHRLIRCESFSAFGCRALVPRKQIIHHQTHCYSATIFGDERSARDEIENLREVKQQLEDEIEALRQTGTVMMANDIHIAVPKGGANYVLTRCVSSSAADDYTHGVLQHPDQAVGHDHHDELLISAGGGVSTGSQDVFAEEDEEMVMSSGDEGSVVILNSESLETKLSWLQHDYIQVKAELKEAQKLQEQLSNDLNSLECRYSALEEERDKLRHICRTLQQKPSQITTRAPDNIVVGQNFIWSFQLMNPVTKSLQYSSFESIAFCVDNDVLDDMMEFFVVLKCVIGDVYGLYLCPTKPRRDRAISIRFQACVVSVDDDSRRSYGKDEFTHSWAQDDGDEMGFHDFIILDEGFVRQCLDTRGYISIGISVAMLESPRLQNHNDGDYKHGLAAFNFISSWNAAARLSLVVNHNRVQQQQPQSYCTRECSSSGYEAQNSRIKARFPSEIEPK